MKKARNPTYNESQRVLVKYFSSYSNNNFSQILLLLSGLLHTTHLQEERQLFKINLAA